MYKRYERYKDSGIEWIGEIPEHWGIGKLKFVLSLKSGTSISKDEYVDDGLYPIYGSNGIIGKTNKYNINKRSIIIGRVGASGELQISDRGWVTDNALIVNIIDSKIDFIYLFYWLSSLNLSDYASKTAQPLITGSTIKKLTLLNLPLVEQKAIANYLDHKTSEIDSLIAEKERLIEKLEEYKQSIITEAVTKGLDPNVKMKDSGIEWIGEIPEHWEISKVKYHSNINQKTLTEKTPDDYEIKYLDISNVDSNGKILKIEPMAFKDAPSRARRIVSDGDTIVSTVRTYLKAITCFDNIESNLVCSTGFAVLSPKESIEPKFLSYLMKSSLYVEEIVSRSVGVSYPAITASEIADLNLIVPPINEQKAIIDYIDDIVKNVENIIVDINCQIQNFKQYRQSLIYEAVTGKIDVREYEPERSEQLA